MRASRAFIRTPVRPRLAGDNPSVACGCGLAGWCSAAASGGAPGTALQTRARATHSRAQSSGRRVRSERSRSRRGHLCRFERLVAFPAARRSIVEGLLENMLGAGSHAPELPHVLRVGIRPVAGAVARACYGTGWAFDENNHAEAATATNRLGYASAKHLTRFVRMHGRRAAARGIHDVYQFVVLRLHGDKKRGWPSRAF